MRSHCNVVYVCQFHGPASVGPPALPAGKSSSRKKIRPKKICLILLARAVPGKSADGCGKRGTPLKECVSGIHSFCSFLHYLINYVDDVPRLPQQAICAERTVLAILYDAADHTSRMTGLPFWQGAETHHATSTLIQIANSPWSSGKSPLEGAETCHATIVTILSQAAIGEQPNSESRAWQSKPKVTACLYLRPPFRLAQLANMDNSTQLAQSAAFPQHRYRPFRH